MGKITFEDGSSCDANQLLLDITEIWRENFASRPVTGIVLGTSGESDKYIVSVDGDLCLVKNGIGMAFYSGDRCMMLSPDGNPDNWVIIAKI